MHEDNAYSVGVFVLCWYQYTDTSVLTATFVESKLDIVTMKIDHVSYYRIAGNIVGGN